MHHQQRSVLCLPLSRNFYQLKFFRSFLAEMGFYVKELGRRKQSKNIFVLFFLSFIFFCSDITAHETGSNKQTASKSCALSLVRQLFHLGVIEPFSGTLKKNKESEQMKPYPVVLAPELESQIMDTLQCLQVSPIPIVSLCPHHYCRAFYIFYHGCYIHPILIFVSFPFAFVAIIYWVVLFLDNFNHNPL